MSRREDFEGLSRISRRLFKLTMIPLVHLRGILRSIQGGDLDTLQRNYNLGNRFSLPEGSIIANPLYVPDLEEGFERYDSTAGKFSSVRFSPDIGTEVDMVLGGFKLDEYKDNPQNQLTPTLPYNPIKLEDALDTDYSAFRKLLEFDFIVVSTMAQAYGHVFPYDLKLQTRLSEAGISDKTAYQVTPKGNSLVLLIREMGDKKPTYDSQAQVNAVPARI